MVKPKKEMTVFGSIIQKAFDNKKTDIKQFTWKFKKDENGKQREARLLDITEQELKECYAHVMSMLFSTDKKTPGRCKLMEMLDASVVACNAELFKRYVSVTFNTGANASAPGNISAYLSSLRKVLDSEEGMQKFPRAEWDTIVISSVMDNIPPEYAQIPVKVVLRALQGRLGKLDASHITQRFILQDIGVWPTKEEKEEYLHCKATESDRAKLEAPIRENLKIKPDRAINITSHGLSYDEFRGMVKLRTALYSSLTKSQLETLRDKVLYQLRDAVDKHATFWKYKKAEIEQVAEKRSITLN